MSTFRPLGPRVTATALARVSTPASKACRPSTPNFISCKTNQSFSPMSSSA